ncbi:ABC transporter related [Ignisphaera aggregans DSM 17230]|uniref:ABC transporter related n=1 Tax=Ignisphaera aggregans (strain DSM 17230 / JCM 13409 / AQ1.S1) TaxID=583356 RepID=E0SS35_IGNAA|nr:ABC transporter related [Ignisphaera aggregans DSM 17230]
MPLLEVRNLVKIYETGLIRRQYIRAVDNVSFDVNEGEIISLVGESGSGKTTTARMILRLIRPTSGVIKFMDRDIWKDLKTQRDLKWYWRNVNGVFQDPYASFNPTHRIRDVLLRVFNLFDVHIDEDTKIRTIEEALRFVGLRPEEVLERRPFELSGGMRQRILIARTIIIKPKLIVADEPTSMIDATLRIGILDILLKLREELKSSIIFITHDLGLATYVSDRILVMYKGKIVEEGTPEELLNNPKHEYTRSLLTAVPKLYSKWF